jgi:hypothetical protein
MAIVMVNGGGNTPHGDAADNPGNPAGEEPTCKRGSIYTSLCNIPLASVATVRLASGQAATTLKS